MSVCGGVGEERERGDSRRGMEDRVCFELMYVWECWEYRCVYTYNSELVNYSVGVDL